MTRITSLLRRPTALMATLALFASIGLAACGDDSSDDSGDGESTGEESSITVADAWARSSPSVASAGAAYMVITNEGDVDDVLLSAAVSTDVAGTTEVHETRAAEGGMGGEDMGDDDGAMGEDDGMGDDDSTSSSMPMMEMVPVDRIELPAGGTIVMEPGGYHVMMLDLVEPLEEGDEIEIVLTFEVAGEVTVVAVVGDGPA